MAGFFRKAMDYLGLDDDGGYQDYDPYEDQPAAPTRRPAANSEPDPGMVYPKTGYTPSSVVVTSAADQGLGSSVHGVTAQPRAMSPSVRTVTPVMSNKVYITTPVTFADAQDIGERFRSGQLVLMNVRQTERDVIKRLVDFSSGLIFGLNGDIKKVADRVFLLTPNNVELSSDEERRLREKGLFT